MYKNYKPGLNCKGLKSKSFDETHPKVTSERGQRRATRERKTHIHEWIMCKTVTNPSYHDARVQNESRYYCRRSHVRKTGGGVWVGCDATCRQIKGAT
jgi:hypothetical protein